MAVPAGSVALDSVVRRFRRGGGVGPVSLEVAPGTVVGLVGSNGSGKTTLLKLVCGLLACQSGTVRVGGELVRPGVPPPGLGAVIEEPPFYEFTTATENLRLAAAGRIDREARIDECLDRVELSAHALQKVGEFSQGMRQRLGLARALLGQPSLLVLDEPANGLDPRGIRWLRELVLARARDGVTVLVSSHMLGEISRVADTALLLRAGSVVAVADAADLTKGSEHLENLYFGAQL